MRRLSVLGLALALLLSPALLAQKKAKPKEVFTDPADPALPADFKFQGEYASKGLGAQVIALGGGKFQAVIYPGGLPGAGWDGKHKTLVAGHLDGGKVALKPIGPKEKRRYLAGPADQFSASGKFPPPGQREYGGTIEGDTLALDGPDAKIASLKKTKRVSPTMGAKPPEGAEVLFDGKGKDAWTGGRVDKKTGWLNTDGHDIRTKKKFNDYTAHVEFMLPFRPAARSQGRGNGGFYQVDMYEVQLLDSFGLDGKNNECGGVYTKLAPSVNMCMPPLAWQTYDIAFTNAVNEKGKKTKNARITIKHNGVVIIDDKEITGKTGGARGDPEGTPGPLQLQGHGNPLQFRNIWVVEKK